MSVDEKEVEWEQKSPSPHTCRSRGLDSDGTSCALIGCRDERGHASLETFSIGNEIRSREATTKMRRPCSQGGRD